MNYEIRLRRLREENNLTRSDIAKLLNISISLYCRYEKQYQIIPLKFLNILSNFFNVSIDYLLNLTNIPNYKNNKLEIDKILCAKRLREFRKKNNITQRELSKYLNTTQSTFSAYENATNLILTPFLYSICKKYNLSSDYLLGKTNKPIYLIAIKN